MAKRRKKVPLIRAAKIAKIVAQEGPAGLTEDQRRAAWHNWRQGMDVTTAAKNAAAAKHRDQLRKGKAFGFTEADYRTAVSLDTAAGERGVYNIINRALWVARAEDHPLGSQLDLFQRNAGSLRPTPEAAYDQGKTASMKNQPRKPPYHHTSEEYAQWIEGYADHQHQLARQFKAPGEERAPRGRRGVARKGQGKGQRRRRQEPRLVEPTPQPAPAEHLDAAE